MISLTAARDGKDRKAFTAQLIFACSACAAGMSPARNAVYSVHEDPRQEILRGADGPIRAHRLRGQHHLVRAGEDVEAPLVQFDDLAHGVQVIRGVLHAAQVGHGRDQLVHDIHGDVDPGRAGDVVDVEGQAGGRGDLDVVLLDALGADVVVERRDGAGRVRADLRRMAGKRARRPRGQRAHVHHDRHPALDLPDNGLRHGPALRLRHQQALPGRPKDVEAGQAAGQLPLHEVGQDGEVDVSIPVEGGQQRRHHAGKLEHEGPPRI